LIFNQFYFETEAGLEVTQTIDGNEEFTEHFWINAFRIPLTITGCYVLDTESNICEKDVLESPRRGWIETMSNVDATEDAHVYVKMKRPRGGTNNNWKFEAGFAKESEAYSYICATEAKTTPGGSGRILRYLNLVKQ
jgi:hypothetical protein